MSALFKDDNNSSRFICPGCGERSSSQNHGLYCKSCDAFVHRECQVQGEHAGGGKYSYFGAYCPLCHNNLGARYFDFDVDRNLHY